MRVWRVLAGTLLVEKLKHCFNVLGACAHLLYAFCYTTLTSGDEEEIDSIDLISWDQAAIRVIACHSAPGQARIKEQRATASA